MGLFGENFPYTNTHDLNLDWVIKRIQNVYNDENTSFSYTDIKGHWVEEAAVKLAEIQVARRTKKNSKTEHNAVFYHGKVKISFHIDD